MVVGWILRNESWSENNRNDENVIIIAGIDDWIEMVRV